MQKLFKSNTVSFEENNGFIYNDNVYLFDKAILESNDKYNSVYNLIKNSKLSKFGLTIILSLDSLWDALKDDRIIVVKTMKEYVDYAKLNAVDVKKIVRIIYDKPSDQKHTFPNAFAWYINDNCKKPEILSSVYNKDLLSIISPTDLTDTLVCVDDFKYQNYSNECPKHKKICNLFILNKTNAALKDKSGNIPLTKEVLINVDSWKNCPDHKETSFILDAETEHLYKYYIGAKTINKSSMIKGLFVKKLIKE